MTRIFDSPDWLVDALIDAVGRNVVLGLPVGIGKAIHIADALFARAVTDESLRLKIFTGLTLETPRGNSELEARFLGPLVRRLYREWPTPAYADALRRNELPSNVEISEFYLKPGAYLGNPLVQQTYTSINYSQVVAELVRLGINVVAQAVARDPERPGRYSLSSNPEVTLDLLPHFEHRRRRGESIAMIGQVGRHLPYMTGDAEISAERFDFILESDALDYAPFPLPNRPVDPADYAVGMHVASLVPDGATIQIGIGSLSDAVAHCLKIRHEAPDIFSTVLELLPGGAGSSRRSELPIEMDRFEVGLFASTELLSDALYSLFDAGIITRVADENDLSAIHAGFFIGSRKMYAGLQSLSKAQRQKINMTRISWVNTLYGDEARKRKQRRNARFINETMMVTLLGAAVSDALEDGRVVSGVGGQFDFVSMAHALDDAYSILMCRARRIHDGVAQSNFRWAYGHTTVPRHHRDIFVSEYGIAPTRGRSDSEVIDAMLGIADVEFQEKLVEQAVRSGKLARNYTLPSEARNNRPEMLIAIFERPDLKTWFPRYPLGTDLTAVEQELVDALGWLKNHAATPAGTFLAAVRAFLTASPRDFDEALARMQLDAPKGIKQHLMQRMLRLALGETKK